MKDDAGLRSGLAAYPKIQPSDLVVVLRQAKVQRRTLAKIDYVWIKLDDQPGVKG
ncbi:hypothetical protein [Dyella sp.]|uniref:hypothetical protein n=1 Tax=Dyella sp. TaxID=1869338 RepID=UPI0028503D1D|nr:hypothetical protein [Dyella sp.]MDR3443703.1 hypothetical protein [Dyella sp.]